MKASSLLAVLSLAAGIGLGFSLNAAAEPTGYPLNLEVAVQDGESEDHLFYSGSSKVSLEFNAKGIDPAKQQAARLAVYPMGQEEPKPLEVTCKRGAWDLDLIYFTPDGQLTILTAKDREKEVLQFFRSQPWELLLETELVPVAEDQRAAEWPFQTTPVAVEGKRLYFSRGVPAQLQPFFASHLALPKSAKAWSEIIWPQHMQSVVEYIPAIQDIHAVGEAKDPDSLKARKMVEDLLAAKPVPINPAKLVGDWRVRSVQGSGQIIYAYPFFKCRFSLKDGRLFFEKTTGSQRRSGVLLPDSTERMIFLGGSSVNEDPQRGYSQVVNPTSMEGGNPPESDSAGVLLQLGPKRCVMFLDARFGSGYEVYELIR